MIKFSIFLIFTFLIFAHCKNPVPTVNLVGSQDPDIVLVNIENGDREFIGKVLLKIDSLNPTLIGVDVFFQGKKTKGEDSILIHALEIINNLSNQIHCLLTLPKTKDFLNMTELLVLSAI